MQHNSCHYFTKTILSLFICQCWTLKQKNYQIIPKQLSSLFAMSKQSMAGCSFTVLQVRHDYTTIRLYDIPTLYTIYYYACLCSSLITAGIRRIAIRFYSSHAYDDYSWNLFGTFLKLHQIMQVRINYNNNNNNNHIHVPCNKLSPLF